MKQLHHIFRIFNNGLLCASVNCEIYGQCASHLISSANSFIHQSNKPSLAKVGTVSAWHLDPQIGDSGSPYYFRREIRGPGVPELGGGFSHLTCIHSQLKMATQTRTTFRLAPDYLRLLVSSGQTVRVLSGQCETRAIWPDNNYNDLL